VGVHVKVAQRLAGHASERMTLGVYTHVVDADLRAAIARLGGQGRPHAAL
jgi:integrase